MKKWLSLLLAIMMMFTLTACGGGGGEAEQQAANNNEAVEQQQSDAVAFNDYFYDHYDFCEAWMLPDDGVYIGYEYVSPDSNKAGNEMVVVRIEDITEVQIEAYIQKINEQGYEHLIGDSYSKKTDFGVSMIEIDNYLEDGYINIKIDPSI